MARHHLPPRPNPQTPVARIRRRGGCDCERSEAILCFPPTMRVLHPNKRRKPFRGSPTAPSSTHRPALPAPPSHPPAASSCSVLIAYPSPTTNRRSPDRACITALPHTAAGHLRDTAHTPALRRVPWGQATASPAPPPRSPQRTIPAGASHTPESAPPQLRQPPPPAASMAGSSP